MITSLYQSLCNMETNIADRVALRWYDEEKQGVAEVHYAQYAQDLRRFVAFLRAEYGDVRGKRVAILARNSSQHVICMYGTVIAGGVAVPLNLGKDWDAISYELGLTEPVCILQDGEFAEREPALTETYGSILKPMDAFSAYEPAEDVTEVEDLSALAFIMFTSGTTGRSKGVMLSQKNLFSAMPAFLNPCEEVHGLEHRRVLVPVRPAHVPHLGYDQPCFVEHHRPLRQPVQQPEVLLPGPRCHAQRCDGRGACAAEEHLQ